MILENKYFVLHQVTRVLSGPMTFREAVKYVGVDNWQYIILKIVIDELGNIVN